MKLAFLPQRTDAATRANAVRRPLFGFCLFARITLDDHDNAEGIIVGQRKTLFYGFAEYKVQRLDTGAQLWVMGVNLSPKGRPKLVLIEGGKL